MKTIFANTTIRYYQIVTARKLFVKKVVKNQKNTSMRDKIQNKNEILVKILSFQFVTRKLQTLLQDCLFRKPSCVLILKVLLSIVFRFFSTQFSLIKFRAWNLLFFPFYLWKDIGLETFISRVS